MISPSKVPIRMVPTRRRINTGTWVSLPGKFVNISLFIWATHDIVKDTMRPKSQKKPRIFSAI
jgi:hypothetical protein